MKMSRAQWSSSCLVLDETSKSPSWDQVYADLRLPDDAAARPASPAEGLEEKDPVGSDDEDWWTRSSPWRRHDMARGCRGFRAPVSTQRWCGCSCNCRQSRYAPRRHASLRYKQRRCRPWRYRPRADGPSMTPWEHIPSMTPWEHIPVVIQPTRWYQVVGSKPCSCCRAKGRYQKTSWMCGGCRVPLCLLPYRNCYGEWHGHRG